MNEIIEFANLKFRGLTRQKLFVETSDEMKVIVTANAEFIVKGNQDESFKKIIDNNYTTFDGQIPYVIAKLCNRKTNFEKISGSDLIYDVCKIALEKKRKVFLLGGLEESNHLAVQKLREKYVGLDIKGFSPPFMPEPFLFEHNNKMIDVVRSFSPYYLFVGFGGGKQERWIMKNEWTLKQIGVKMCVGSGGTFEMVSGKYKRAPRWIQIVGLEGVYRFICEPHLFRFKRLMVSMKMFKYL